VLRVCGRFWGRLHSDILFIFANDNPLFSQGQIDNFSGFVITLYYKSGVGGNDLGL
jgi:hypothetical protein